MPRVTTVAEDEDFVACIIDGGSLLHDVLVWITDNMCPEDVFNYDALDVWATKNDYVKRGDKG